MTIKETEKELESKGYIGIFWNITDVIERAEDKGHVLSENEAMQILKSLKYSHDCNYGITWETIDAEIANFEGNK